MKMTLVTGNSGKLREWQRVLPKDFPIETHEVDLDEIQSDDLEAIVADKAKRAYAELGVPVVVEDVAAGLDKLGGLPGPFIKFFMKKLGSEALYTLAGSEGEAMVVSCAVAYYDGTHSFTVKGEVRGTAVAPRGDNGFGFDVVFVPDGETRTFAEMSDAEKDRVSHRARAIRLFVEALEKSGLR